MVSKSPGRAVNSVTFGDNFYSVFIYLCRRAQLQHFEVTNVNGIPHQVASTRSMISGIRRLRVCTTSNSINVSQKMTLMLPHWPCLGQRHLARIGKLLEYSRSQILVKIIPFVMQHLREAEATSSKSPNGRKWTCALLVSLSTQWISRLARMPLLQRLSFAREAHSNILKLPLCTPERMHTDGGFMNEFILSSLKSRWGKLYPLDYAFPTCLSTSTCSGSLEYKLNVIFIINLYIDSAVFNCISTGPTRYHITR